jgi:hypothetical protein
MVYDIDSHQLHRAPAGVTGYVFSVFSDFLLALWTLCQGVSRNVEQNKQPLFISTPSMSLANSG